MTKQEAISNLRQYRGQQIKEVYDNLNFKAVLTLCPNFEYPDWDYRKVEDLWK